MRKTTVRRKNVKTSAKPKQRKSIEKMNHQEQQDWMANIFVNLVGNMTNTNEENK